MYIHIMKNAPPPGGHVFQATGTINLTINVASRVLTRFFNNIIRTNRLTKKNAPPLVAMTNHLTQFHEDRTIKFASRVLTRFYLTTGTIVELLQNIINTNLLTKCYEDGTTNVASKWLTMQILRPHTERRTEGNHKSSSLAHCSQVS
ncbi:hypothetical protein DPMN_122329 [Dreissena polymorpha]|uniref:Uncharacterized protein n=1 Tax=Dreissena polymorpha TaxID=45954 RepID=A0A9D4GNU2_DREPO|nr:hypothetical protein DPMN_122329 [Dreissena polymorpha]